MHINNLQLCTKYKIQVKQEILKHIETPCDWSSNKMAETHFTLEKKRTQNGCNSFHKNK